MKARIGFVSNSSSSSFIVTEGTTKQVCQRMLSILAEEYAEYWKELMPQLDSAEEALAELPDGYDGPILLPHTCNYETVIVRVGDDIHVYTSNNHDWSDLPRAELPCNEMVNKYDVLCYDIHSRRFTTLEQFTYDSQEPTPEDTIRVKVLSWLAEVQTILDNGVDSNTEVRDLLSTLVSKLTELANRLEEK